MRGEGAQLIDVLSAKEYKAEHIPGAINIPLKLSVARRRGGSTSARPSSSTATTISET